MCTVEKKINILIPLIHNICNTYLVLIRQKSQIIKGKFRELPRYYKTSRIKKALNGDNAKLSQ